jgi:hypothetical protein
MCRKSAYPGGRPSVHLMRRRSGGNRKTEYLRRLRDADAATVLASAADKQLGRPRRHNRRPLRFALLPSTVPRTTAAVISSALRFPRRAYEAPRDATSLGVPALIAACLTRVAHRRTLFSPLLRPRQVLRLLPPHDFPVSVQGANRDIVPASVPSAIQNWVEPSGQHSAIPRT